MAKIAIIDDDVEFAEDVSLFLEKEGHIVSMRDNLDGAVEELVQNTPDLLILDVMFPGNCAGGFDTAKAIRERTELKALPIIMLTAVNEEFSLPLRFSDKDIDVNWMPVEEFVEKPVDMKDLLQKVRKLVKEPSVH